MTDSSKPDSMKTAQDRRTFLKIGAGVVAGAAVASVVEIPYYSSVIGGNNSSSSSTVSSLNDQLNSTASQLSDTQSALAATQSQLGDTQSSLSAANNTIGGLNSQLTSSSQALSSASAQAATLNSQLTSTQGALNSAQGSLTSANSQVSSLKGQVTSLQGQVSTATSQVNSLNNSLGSAQATIDERNAFLSLSTTEQVELTAICAAIIPSDSTGPGANETGAVYFVDRQLRSTYGTNGNVYRQPPYVPANVLTAFTVDGITYPGGSVTYVNGPNTYTVKYNPTANVRVSAGSRWQYPFDMKQFWTIGLAGIQAYAIAAYGGKFETLSAANQTACLTDLWTNKPTYDGSVGNQSGGTGGPAGNLSGGAAGGYQEIIAGVNGINQGVPGGSQFGAVLPSDFAYELFFMVWNGYWLDPVYGGNWGMLGWKYVGFNGVNMGNFYGEGYTTKQLMVMNTPVVLQPASLGQYQKGSP